MTDCDEQGGPKIRLTGGQPRRVGIIGNAADKFGERTRSLAMIEIGRIIGAATLRNGNVAIVSGGCHLGGVDQWAEEAADCLTLEKRIHLPAKRQWEGGYKQRNLLIAEDSDELHIVLATAYPASYAGTRFPRCYRCGTDSHIKSGACWTARVAKRLGKPVFWHLIT